MEWEGHKYLGSSWNRKTSKINAYDCLCQKTIHFGDKMCAISYLASTNIEAQNAPGFLFT